MAEYIEREAVVKESTFMFDEALGWCKCVLVEDIEKIPAADVVEVVHGEWNLEVHSFYVDNWDESTELCVYILASCSNCGEKHHQHQVFSKHLYAPEDADDDFRFDQEYEKSKALEEFKQKGYKFQNYCPNCGADMRGRTNDL